MSGPMRGGSRGGGSSGDHSSRDPVAAVRNLRGTIHGDLHTRPDDFEKLGTSGRPVDCMANFVALETDATFSIFQYHVMFEPEVDAKSVRQAILASEAVTAEIGNTFIFDGMILYLTKEWSREQILEAQHPITKQPVAVKFKNSVRFQHNDPQTINCYNIVLRRCMDQIGYKQMGRNYFDPRRGASVEGFGLEVWPGYETAIRVYEAGLMLCVENRFKVLRTDTILAIMINEFERAGKNKPRMQAKMEELFYGQTIVTHYNNKLYRLSRIDWNMTPESTFTRADGTQTTLKDYFKVQYNLDVQDSQQPIIISEGKPKQPGEAPQLTYLIPEFCRPTGLTDDMRKNFRLMRALSHHTRMDPQKRYQSTGALIGMMTQNPSCAVLLNTWQLRLGNDLVNVRARELEPERLVGKNPQGFIGQNAEWARDCKRAGNYGSKDMLNWILVAPNHPNSIQAAQKFIGKVKELGKGLAMNVGDPMCATTQSTQVTDYMNAIQGSVQQVQGHEIHMIVVMLADDNKTRYDAIKKMLCTQDALGVSIPSQCVLQSTLIGKGAQGGENKNFDSIVLKILLQMNCKMGGSLWKVNIPIKNAMIVGYDLYHDSTMKGKTVGACVSTYNSDFTQFYSQTRPHENPTELGTNLTHFIRKALRKYYLANGKTLPEKLFLYRDGAGDGQIPYIRNQEVTLVKEACAEVVRKSGLGDHEIKLSFTIVTKKVNMRVFRRQGAQLTNPSPGTVVDDIVTRPERYDFYLVPQAVNQGTVTPVCYNVISDNTGLKPDNQQKLAFKLCHLYYNWQGTVRVPAPCQYAHKLAFLVAQSVHREADETLRDKLFFL